MQVSGLPNTYVFLKPQHNKQRRAPSRLHTTTLIKDRRVCRWKHPVRFCEPSNFVPRIHVLGFQSERTNRQRMDEPRPRFSYVVVKNGVRDYYLLPISGVFVFGIFSKQFANESIYKIIIMSLFIIGNVLFDRDLLVPYKLVILLKSKCLR